MPHRDKVRIATLEKRVKDLEAIVNTIPDVLIRINRQGTYLAFYPKPGFPMPNDPKTIVGNNISNILSPGFAAILREKILWALDNHKERASEQKHHYQGKVWYYETRVIPAGSDEVLLLVRNVTGKRLVAQQSTEAAMSFYEQLGRYLLDAGEITEDETVVSDIHRSNHQLSATESQILMGVTQGQTNAQIGKTMSLSASTVANHLTNIYKKINVKSRAQAAAYVLHYGIDPMHEIK